MLGVGINEKCAPAAGKDMERPIPVFWKVRQTSTSHGAQASDPTYFTLGCVLWKAAAAATVLVACARSAGNHLSVSQPGNPANATVKTTAACQTESL